MVVILVTAVATTLATIAAVAAPHPWHVHRAGGDHHGIVRLPVLAGGARSQSFGDCHLTRRRRREPQLPYGQALRSCALPREWRSFRMGRGHGAPTSSSGMVVGAVARATTVATAT